MAFASAKSALTFFVLAALLVSITASLTDSVDAAERTSDLTHGMRSAGAKLTPPLGSLRKLLMDAKSHHAPALELELHPDSSNGRRKTAELSQGSAGSGKLQVPAQNTAVGLPIGSKVVDANVVIETEQPLSATSKDFVCVTMDWWPKEKCDYGVCAWGDTSVLNQDLTNPILRGALKALSPVLRIGGSLQDHIVYKASADVSCEPMVWDDTEMFRCRGGCLTMQRWDEFYEFANSSRAQLVFGLNALYGRNRTGWYTFEGDWNASNARAFLDYNIRAGYSLLGVELGNEVGGSNGIAAKLSPVQYARDIRTLRTVVDDLYAAGSPSQLACLNRTGRAGPLCVPKPLIIAPDGIDFDDVWYSDFVRELGNGTLVLDGLSHHLYSMGPGVSPEVDKRMLDPVFHDGQDAMFRRARAVKAQAAPGTQLWLGEAGGAFNSGRPNASDAFLNGFWYLHEMGSTARHSYDVFCRQSLIGGNYGLLQKGSALPTPDLYAALLWTRLMGPTVLQANVSAPDVRAFAHCLKGDDKGGIALVLINYSNDTAYQLSHNLGNAVRDALVQVTDNIVRDEYHFTASDGGDMHSKISVLNSVELRTVNGSLPEVAGLIVPDKQQVLRLGPLSYAFVALKGANVTSCRA